MRSLTTSEMKKIEELYHKLKNKTLQKQEAEEFKTLLEKKKQETEDTGDFILAMCAVFILAGLVGYKFDK